MRKIEREMLDAIQNRHNWSKDNTAVTQHPVSNAASVFLYNNRIAIVDYGTATVVPVEQTLKQWPTRTTLSRLWELGVDAHRTDNKIYLNGEYLCPAR